MRFSFLQVLACRFEQVSRAVMKLCEANDEDLADVIEKLKGNEEPPLQKLN